MPAHRLASRGFALVIGMAGALLMAACSANPADSPTAPSSPAPGASAVAHAFYAGTRADRRRRQRLRNVQSRSHGERQRRDGRRANHNLGPRRAAEYPAPCPPGRRRGVAERAAGRRRVPAGNGWFVWPDTRPEWGRRHPGDLSWRGRIDPRPPFWPDARGDDHRLRVPGRRRPSTGGADRRPQDRLLHAGREVGRSGRPSGRNS